MKTPKHIMLDLLKNGFNAQKPNETPQKLNKTSRVGHL